MKEYTNKAFDSDYSGFWYVLFVDYPKKGDFARFNYYPIKIQEHVFSDINSLIHYLKDTGRLYFDPDNPGDKKHLSDFIGGLKNGEHYILEPRLSDLNDLLFEHNPESHIIISFFTFRYTQFLICSDLITPEIDLNVPCDLVLCKTLSEHAVKERAKEFLGNHDRLYIYKRNLWLDTSTDNVQMPYTPISGPDSGDRYNRYIIDIEDTAQFVYIID